MNRDACQGRYAYLERVLKTEFPYLDAEISIANSAAAQTHIADRLNALDRRVRVSDVAKATRAATDWGTQGPRNLLDSVCWFRHIMEMSDSASKPVEWVGSSYKDFRAFPGDVQDHMGYALHLAQTGDKHEDAKPLRGFGGAGVLEIVSNHVGDTYRAVYTVKFAQAIYVLHAFQKKSKTGSKTPTTEIDLIERRLKVAEADYKAQFAKGTRS